MNNVWLGALLAVGLSACWIAHQSDPPARPAPAPAPVAQPAPERDATFTPASTPAHVTSGDPQTGEAIVKMQDFSDRMCQCADRPCIDQVTEEMTRWGQSMAGQATSAIGDQDAKAMATITQRMVDCMTRAMGASSPTPP